MTDLHPFIAGLPKAELHVHHVGSASPRIVAELAARHADSKVPTDPDALADYFTFTDFAHFIEVYLSVVDLVRTPEDVRPFALLPPPAGEADQHVAGEPRAEVVMRAAGGDGQVEGFGIVVGGI